MAGADVPVVACMSREKSRWSGPVQRVPVPVHPLDQRTARLPQAHGVVDELGERAGGRQRFDGRVVQPPVQRAAPRPHRALHNRARLWRHSVQVRRRR